MIKHLKQYKKVAVLGVATFVAAVVGVLSVTSYTLTSASDCSDNSIVRCGVTTATDFVSRLKNNSPSDLRSIYRAYNLSDKDYDSFAGHSRPGKAYKNGTVVVDGRVVVRDGMSLGRQAKSYSHPKVINVNGTNVTYHESRLGDVFLSDGLPVIVFFNAKGVASTVVMNDCGNPITGNPVEPVMTCDRLNRSQVDRDTFAFTTSANASNGASIHHVVYDFGDGSPRVEKANPSERVEHTYAKPGSYAAKVTVYVSLPGNNTYAIVPAGECVREVVVAAIPTNPAIQVNKTVAGGKEDAIVGATREFTYEIAVTNTGDVDLANIVASDKAPAGVTFLRSDKGSVSSTAWTWTIPSLKVGATVKAVITATAPNVFDGRAKNTVCVNTPQIPGFEDDCDDAYITTHHPAVEITKLVNGQENIEVAPNVEYTYSLLVKNTGDVYLKNVTVTDRAPRGVTFVRSDVGTIAGNAWSTTIAELERGGTREFKIVAKVTEPQLGPIVNTACVNAPTVNPQNPTAQDDCDDATVTTKQPVVSCDNLTVNALSRTEFKLTTNYTVKNAVFQKIMFEIKDASGAVVAVMSDADGIVNYTQSKPGVYTVRATVHATVDGKPVTATSAKCAATFEVKPMQTNPLVEITKTVDGVKAKQVEINAPFTYKLTVTNKGNVALKNLVVIDTPQTGIVLVSATQGTITGNTWRTTIGELGVDQSVSFELIAKVTQQLTGNLVNTACVNAVEVNPNEPQKNDDCDDATVSVTPVVTKNPNIAITKLVNDVESIQVAVGEVFAYKLIVKNTGELDMKQVVVRDTAPAGVMLISSSVGTIAANTWAHTIAELKVGESVEVVLTAKVNSYVSGNLVNTACVNAAEVNSNEPNKDDACDTANVSVTPPISNTPQVLPNTGAGSVIGLFGLTTILGAMIYRFALGRKISD